MMRGPSCKKLDSKGRRYLFGLVHLKVLINFRQMDEISDFQTAMIFILLLGSAIILALITFLFMKMPKVRRRIWINFIIFTEKFLNYKLTSLEKFMNKYISQNDRIELRFFIFYSLLIILRVIAPKKTLVPLPSLILTLSL